MVQIRDLAQLQGLQDLDAIIELYILDLTSLDPGRAPYRFCNWSQTNGQGVRYAGEEYEPAPVECSGFEINSNNAPSEPRMQVNNVGLTWTGLASRWDDLVGAKLIRRRVLRRYLDDGATPSATGHWPDEPWFIEQKVSENKLVVTFALSTAFGLDDIKLPKRLALRHTCSWTYRSEACGYAGPPVADARDQALTGGTDPAVQAYLNAVAAFHAYSPEVAAQQAAVLYAEGVYNASTASAWRRVGAWFNRNMPYDFVFTWPIGSIQWWLGQVLAYRGSIPLGPLNDTWRRGALRAQNFDGSAYYEIEQWEFVQGTRDTALANLNMARANLQNALNVHQGLRQTALNLRAAAAAVIDPRDQCSKTLNGCRLRFYDPLTGAVAPLPTSAFPGLQIG